LTPRLARRLLRGIDTSEEPLALHVMREVGHAGNFLRTKHTRKWFRKELFMPSPVIDRDDRDAWVKKGSKDAAQRAHERVEEIIAAYQPKPLAPEVVKALEEITLRAARANGLDQLPPLELSYQSANLPILSLQ